MGAEAGATARAASPGAGVTWRPIVREYALGAELMEPEPRELAQQDPLRRQAPAHEPDVKDVAVGEDPLCAARAARAAMGALAVRELKAGDKRPAGAWRSRWQALRSVTLGEFTVSGTVKVDASFLHGMGSDAGGDASQSSRKQQHKSVVLSKSKLRLEHLEARTDSGTIVVSQKQYTDRIERLRLQLEAAWAGEQRMRALRLASRCAKMLEDTSVPQYYPALWVQVVDILDWLAERVMDRLRDASALQADAGEAACRSWFFKIASVRGLLPRLYLETALLECWSCYLMGPEEQRATQLRLAGAARGVGDPLAALYCRAFLAHRVSLWCEARSGARSRAPLMQSFHDYLFTMAEFSARRSAAFWTRHGFTPEQYVRLHAPGIEVLLSACGRDASQEDFVELYSACCPPEDDNKGNEGNHDDEEDSAPARRRSNAKNGHLGVVLALLLASFPPELYADRALSLVMRVKERGLAPEVAARVFARLADGLWVLAPAEREKIPILNEVWRIVGEADLEAYVICSAAFIRLALKHYSEREVDVLLQHLLGRLDPSAPDGGASGAGDESLAPGLERVCLALCEAGKDDLGSVLANQSLLRLLYLFKSERKSAICKSLVARFIAGGGSQDPIVVHAAFALCRELHDALDALSPEWQREETAQLVCGFIDCARFEDPQQYLTLLLDSRATFCNLPEVTRRIVLAAVSTAWRAGGRKATRWRGDRDLIRSCVAFCHMTIPSVEDPLERMRMLQLAAGVALHNGLLAQMDALLKLAVRCVCQLPADVDQALLVERVACLAGALVLAPGDPEAPLALPKGLLEAVASFAHWRPRAMERAQRAVLLVLAALSQPHLPGKVPGVASNDTLFCRGEAYMCELQELIDAVVAALLDAHAATGCAEDALELVQVLLVAFGLDTPGAHETVRALLAAARPVAQSEAAKGLGAMYENCKRLLSRLADAALTARSESRARQREHYLALLAEM